MTAPPPPSEDFQLTTIRRFSADDCTHDDKRVLGAEGEETWEKYVEREKQPETQSPTTTPSFNQEFGQQKFSGDEENPECALLNFMTTAEFAVDQTKRMVAAHAIDTTEEKITIGRPRPAMESRDQCHILPLKNETMGKPDSKRLGSLRKSMKTEHLQGKEKQGLGDVCKQYSDMFYLDGDRLETTPVWQQEIVTQAGLLPVREWYPMVRVEWHPGKTP